MNILIVEDDFTSRLLLHEFLKAYGTCHQAVNGEEALAAFTRMLEQGTPYGLICLDIMMPGMTGQEVLRKLREIERQKGVGGSDAVKIVMTSALDDAKNIMQALVRGSSDGYFTKPLDLKKMRKWLADAGINPVVPGGSA